MTDIRINRKLAAILAADVVGYSRMMGANEAERWSHLLRQPAKVDSSMQRTNHHEDAETVFG